MRRECILLLILLLVPTVSGLSVAGPEESLELQVSKDSDDVELVLQNNGNISASNISLEVLLEEKFKKKYELEGLKAGSNSTFTLSDDDLSNLSVENVSHVSWNISASWNEEVSASFDLMSPAEARNRSILSQELGTENSPVVFKFRRDRFVLFDDEDGFSRQVYMGYRPYSTSRIEDFDVLVKGPDYLNVSFDEKVAVGDEDYRVYSLESTSSYLQGRDKIQLDISASYKTFYSEGTIVQDVENDYSVLDILNYFLVIFF